MPFTPTTSNSDPSLVELVDYSSKALLRKQQGRSPNVPREASHLSPVNWFIENDREASFELLHLNLDVLHQEDDTRYSESAAPIMPLRQRDVQALADLFGTCEIQVIEEDIQQNLLNRYPEPCWEDDPFEFLREYL